MRKVANTRELQAELQALLTYAQSPNPSRETLASDLRKLAKRVADNHGERTAKTPGEWVDWIDKTLSEPGRDLAGFAKHLALEGRGDLSPAALRLAQGIDHLAHELDEKIGELIIQLGQDS
jgi:hypothetical protein